MIHVGLTHCGVPGKNSVDSVAQETRIIMHNRLKEVLLGGPLEMMDHEKLLFGDNPNADQRIGCEPEVVAGWNKCRRAVGRCVATNIVDVMPQIHRRAMVRFLL